MKTEEPLGTIGMIGLGHMGTSVALRLLGRGFRVVVYNRTRAKAEALAAHGAYVVDSLSDVAANVDFLISFLPDDRAVREVYLAPDGVIAHAAKGLRILEMSTVLPQTARLLYHAGATRGIPVLDAPVSGSTPVAEQGALTVLAGGDADAFEAAVPLFRQIARAWFHLGPSGSGASMKLVVNTLLGAGMQAIAEAAALGEKLGLDRERLLEALPEMPVVSAAHRGKLAQAARGDYRPQFPLRLMRKDRGLILGQAAQLGLRMPVAAAAQREFSAEAAGDGDEDFSVVVRRMERLASLDEPELPTAA